MRFSRPGKPDEGHFRADSFGPILRCLSSKLQAIVRAYERWIIERDLKSRQSIDYVYLIQFSFNADG